MTKRLLLVLTEFPPSFGGMQTHAIELSRWLHDRGYHVEVATYRLEEGPAGIPALPFAVHRVMSRVAYQANLRKLAQLARAMNADLIYSSTVYYGELSEQTGVPILCRSAGNDVLRPWIAWPFRVGSRVLDLPWIERQVYRRWKNWDWPTRLEGMMLERRAAMMRSSAKRMEWIFANSAFTEELLKDAEVSGDRVEVLPGGVDVRFFADGCSSRAELGMSEEHFYLLTACRLVEKKGLDTLVEAVGLLRDRGVKLRLLIAGEGGSRRRIEETVARLGLSQSILLLGYVDRERLRGYLQVSDLFVLSSREVVDARTGLRDAETMGRVLCEASACGLPVVTTCSGGIPSVIQDGWNGLLAEPGSVEDLAEKIEAIWRDRELGMRLGRNGLGQARERFDWPVLFAAHESAIEKTLASKG
ncbi:MAG: glycosyltransferase family 4 protein [Acidobacteria bacterium]|nr:glycosyltransferase family 4 protein [Acidobacteriota bacterium]